jgi:poly(A) polymerase
VPLLASFSNMTKLEAALGLAADPVRRLGALGVLLTEDAERLWRRLRLANVEHARLASMGTEWWRVSPTIGAQGGRALLYRLGKFYLDRVLLAWSRSPAGVADTAWRELATLPTTWTPPRFPLKAADFIKRGMTKGPALGVALRSAEDAWIAADFPRDRAALAAILEQATGPLA